MGRNWDLGQFCCTVLVAGCSISTVLSAHSRQVLVSGTRGSRVYVRASSLFIHFTYAHVHQDNLRPIPRLYCCSDWDLCSSLIFLMGDHRHLSLIGWRGPVAGEKSSIVGASGVVCYCRTGLSISAT
jgi:hypothetical protein